MTGNLEKPQLNRAVYAPVEAQLLLIHVLRWGHSTAAVILKPSDKLCNSKIHLARSHHSVPSKKKKEAPQRFGVLDRPIFPIRGVLAVGRLISRRG
jgi:hypothetical protein